MKARKLTAVVTCLAQFFYLAPAFAVDLDRSFSGAGARQSEFVNTNRDKRMMITVNILSGVASPGMHQIPDNVHLLDALALAGGVNEGADPGKVYIKRRVSAGKNVQYETLRFDLTDIMADNGAQYPSLLNHDTIFIEPRPKTDQKLITVLTIVASTVGIVSGVMLIRRWKD